MSVYVIKKVYFLAKFLLFILIKLNILFPNQCVTNYMAYLQSANLKQMFKLQAEIYRSIDL